MSDMQNYVTYDSAGALTGAFIQAPQPEHMDNMIIVDAVIRENWVLYRANEARNGVELAPAKPPAPPASLPTLADYTAAVQAMLDAKPRERRYDGILSACTYATSTVPRFKAEGQACVEWRDAVWARCYDLMADVEAGKMAPPAVDELLAMLPELVWPE